MPAAKSTTMKVILGLLQGLPPARVILDGAPITGLPTRKSSAAASASVPEARRLFGTMTCARTC